MEMDENLDKRLSLLVDFFPDIDVDVLLRAAYQSDTIEGAIDYVLAHSFTLDNNLADCGRVERDTKTLQIHSQVPWMNVDDVEAFVVAHPDLEMGKITRQLQKLSAPSSSRRQKIPLEIDYTSFFVERPPCQKGKRDLILKNFNIHHAIIEALAGDAYDDLDYGLNVQDLRQAALNLHQERVEELQKAATMHSERQKMGGAIAQFYAGRAQQLGQRMEYTNRQAAALTFHNRFYPLNMIVSHLIKPYGCRNFNGEDYDDGSIDLHGLTVKEALNALDVVIDAIQSNHLHSSIRLIVGAGRHSGAGQRLKPAVEDRLRSKNIKFAYDGLAVFTINSNFS